MPGGQQQPSRATGCPARLTAPFTEAVEVRYGEQWFHATVVGFTELGTVQADYFRTDGSLPECAGRGGGGFLKGANRTR